MLLKAFPYSLMNYELRMEPIDTSAQAFMLLARTPKECCMFNAADDDFKSILSESEQDPLRAGVGADGVFLTRDRT